MLGGVDRTLGAEDFLGAGNLQVIDPSALMMCESGANFGARGQSQQLAARSSVKIEAKPWTPAVERAIIGRKNGGNRGIAVEHGGEPIFNYDGDFEIGPVVLQQFNGGRGQ